MKVYKSKMPEITLKYTTKDCQKVKIKTSQDAYKVMLELYDPDTIEYMETAIVLFLNRCNITIGWMKISAGGTTCTIIDQKILFATALKCGASGIIISHNHPSGEVKPSNSDIALTRQVTEIGKLLNIPILDHLIVTENKCYSFADDGEL